MTTNLSVASAEAGDREDFEKLLTVTTVSEFSANDLVDLLKGDRFAIRIRDFLAGEQLAGLRERFIGRDDHEPLATDAQFRRVGYAFSETTNDTERADYFDAALDNIARLRSIASPYPYPADVLRLLLDEAWPIGAAILRNGSSPFFAGVVRYQLGGVDLEPHTDNVDRNLPAGFSTKLLRQLSVNVYLDVPAEGGELQIWNDYPNENEYQSRSGDRAAPPATPPRSTQPPCERTADAAGQSRSVRSWGSSGYAPNGQ